MKGVGSITSMCYVVYNIYITLMAIGYVTDIIILYCVPSEESFSFLLLPWDVAGHRHCV